MKYFYSTNMINHLYLIILRFKMSGMDFVYNQLMKHDVSINDLQRLYPTINMALDDINVFMFLITHSK